MAENEPVIFFERCLALAREAASKNEVPIGAVIVRDNEVISEAFNGTEEEGTFIAHAEILAIQKATKKLGTKYLNDCDLYVTVEPCRMCLAAASLSRLSKIYYLVPSLLFGQDGSGYHDVSVQAFEEPSLTQSAKGVLQDFFQNKRKPR